MDGGHTKGAGAARPARCNRPSQAEDGLSVRDGPGQASQAASGLDSLQEPQLLWGGGAPVFDLDGGEDRKPPAHHVWGDGDGAVADEVGAALAEPVVHQAAVLVFESSGVVTKEAGVATAGREADSVLDGQLIRTPAA